VTLHLYEYISYVVAMCEVLCMVSVLTDDIMRSVLSHELSSLHTIVLSVRCAAVTDKTFSLIGQLC